MSWKSGKRSSSSAASPASSRYSRNFPGFDDARKIFTDECPGTRHEFEPAASFAARKEFQLQHFGLNSNQLANPAGRELQQILQLHVRVRPPFGAGLYFHEMAAARHHHVHV